MKENRAFCCFSTYPNYPLCTLVRRILRLVKAFILIMFIIIFCPPSKARFLIFAQIEANWILVFHILPAAGHILLMGAYFWWFLQLDKSDPTHELKPDRLQWLSLIFVLLAVYLRATYVCYFFND